MTFLFKDPKVSQKVILKNSLGKETQQIIVEVTAKAIRVSSCNMYKFNRDGSLNKADDQHIAETFGALEVDPNGKKPNEAGAKLDAGKNRLGLVLCGFARALQEVGAVGTYLGV